MRPLRATPAAALLAALLAAGCAVEVEGAPCALPGAAADCPAGQRCGLDGRCAASVAPCPSPDPAATVVHVDPARGGASRAAFPFPNGQELPPGCRFRSLDDALFAVSTAPAATVQVQAAPGAAAVLVPAAWPLEIPENVTLRGAPSPAGPTAIRADPDVAGTLVRVRGALAGLRVEGRGATGAGVEVACGAAGVPALRDVAVDGGGTFDPSGVTSGLRAGVSVTGACGARLERVRVERVSGPALAIEPAAAATVAVVGGAYERSEVGIRIRGRATLEPDGATSVQVAGNAGVGILVGSDPLAPAALATVPEAVLDRVALASNGDVGLLVARVAEPGSLVRVQGCDLSANGRGRVRRSGNIPFERRVGGALLSLADPRTLSFHGNRAWSNAGDQVAISTYDGTAWSIAPLAAACGPESNVFACVQAGSLAVRAFPDTVGSTVTVDASYSRWPDDLNYADYLGPGVAVGPYAYCTASNEPAGVRPFPACVP